MTEKYLSFCAVLTTLFVICKAAPFECWIYMNTERSCSCVYIDDHNGNIAFASSGIIFERGAAGAGAGSPDNGTDYKQIGTSNAASSARCCLTINEKKWCVSIENHNGNTTVDDGESGAAGAGAGSPDNGTDYKQIDEQRGKMKTIHQGGNGSFSPVYVVVFFGFIIFLVCLPLCPRISNHGQATIPAASDNDAVLVPISETQQPDDTVSTRAESGDYA